MIARRLRDKKVHGEPITIENFVIDHTIKTVITTSFKMKLLRKKNWIAKQIQVMLIRVFYIKFQATNMKHNLRLNRKLARYETNWWIMTVITMSSITLEFLCCEITNRSFAQTISHKTINRDILCRVNLPSF